VPHRICESLPLPRWNATSIIKPKGSGAAGGEAPGPSASRFAARRPIQGLPLGMQRRHPGPHLGRRTNPQYALGREAPVRRRLPPTGQMSHIPATQLSIYCIDVLGARALGAEWARLPAALAAKLTELSSAQRENLLWGGTYTFTNPTTAVQACCSAIDAVKVSFRWERTGDPLPVQFVLHGDDPAAPLGMDPRMWAFLLPEELYVTKSAWEQWKAAGAVAALPPHVAKDEVLAALRLQLTARACTAPVRLFPRRTAPLTGSGEECFYCGLRDHRPPLCPSRHLRPDVAGLALAGHTSLAGLDHAYSQAFAARSKQAVELPAEAGPNDLRRNPELLAPVAFLDLQRTYQPRFLVSLFLSGADQWPETTVTRGDCGNSTSPICRGVRALLVHNYPDAETQFGDIHGADPATKCYAEVGLALVAVEKDQPQRVRYHLERAAKLATTEAEKLYIQFLRSRLHEVGGDLGGALHLIDEALAQRRPCDALRYRREQLGVRMGRTDGSAQRLQLVASRNRELAMALLLDPWLEAIREDLDRKLLSLWLTALQGGKGKLAAAKAQSATLAEWLGERDPDLVPVLSGVQRLEGKLSRAGYYDVLELERDATQLARSCEHTRHSRHRALVQQLNTVEKYWQPLAQFWKEFGLKNLYRSLGERFAQTQADIERARELAGRGEIGAYREATERVAQVRASLGDLAARSREIGAVPLIYTFLRRFLVYLVMMESLALAVGLAILPLFRLVLNLGKGSPASVPSSSSVLYTLVFAVAPVLALVLTGLKQKKARPPTPPA